MSEIKRKLATIAKIDEIKEHTNADSLELATIRGWQVVVKKGEFKQGDLCVYCEIDSVMPDHSAFEFLKPRKYRIKTTKLRGEISQGIAFKLDVLDEVAGLGAITVTGIGQDVTDCLSVTKYDPPIPACLGGQVKSRFPSHSIKTDEERIQNLKEMFPVYRDNYKWIATEKLDGSSMTSFIWEDEFGIASRNLTLKESETNSFWKVAREQKIEEKMREYMLYNGLKALTLQGELIGEGIQKNKYKLKGQTVRFFRVFDPIKYEFLPYTEGIDAIVGMSLMHVPIIEREMKLPDTYEELILLADGESKLHKTAREGIIFVADTALKDYQGRLSFKVISNKFILKHDL